MEVKPKKKLLIKLIRQSKVCTHYYLHFGNNHKGYEKRIATIKLNISRGFKYLVTKK
jgi:hypothetical protein